MAKKSKLCRYCKGAETFTNSYGFTRWGVRCQLSPPLPIRSFDTQEQAQRSIDEWCTGDGRRGCRVYLLHETGHSYNFSGDLLREYEAMEEATVAKQTYYCKCGKTFKKSSTAQDTGYRMDDYDAGHECYGCPFVEPVIDAWGDTQKIKSYECRASLEKVKYTTTTDMTIEGNWTVHVYTLDLPWLDNFIRTYLQTVGADRAEPGKLLEYEPPKLAKCFSNALSNCGRNAYAFSFQNNKAGKAARKAIFEEFFNVDKTARMGPGLGDKERTLHMIEHAKSEAREAVLQMEDEIFGAEEKEDTEVKIQVSQPSSESCPHYKGIETTYSPKGYCINCVVRRGCDRSILDLKSWVLDGVTKLCLNESTYSTCRFFKREQEKGTITQQDVRQAASELPEAITNAPAELRTITDVTAEIRYYKAQTVQNIIEIGKRLIEAKAMLEHGQWGEWLEHSVEISHRTANNFMSIAQEYSNSQPIANLNYTKLLALLSVPTDERDDFIEATHIVDGEEKTVDEMSTREFQKVVKERDEAKQQLAAAQRDAEEQRLQVEKRKDMEFAIAKKLLATEDMFKELKDENRRQRLDIERLESKPIDVAVQQPSTEEMDVLRNNIRHEVIQSLALPDTYFAKKGVEQATEIFMDAVSGAAANGMIALMRMDAKSAAKTLRVYISTLEQHVSNLNDRLNIMLQVDRTVKEGVDDVDW